MVCVRPSSGSVTENSVDLDIEVTRIDPQPDPNPCPRGEVLWSAKAVISWDIEAACRCVSKKKTKKKGKKKKKKIK